MANRTLRLVRTLVPHFILARVDESAPTGSLEASVLLVDAAGSTALATSLRAAGTHGAEILATITWDVFAPQVDAVVRSGGFVGGFAGDGFVAIFPGPASTSVPRAVTAAHQIRAHMSDCSVHRHEFGESRFEVKAAISHGEVSWHIWHAPGVKAGPSRMYMFSGAAVLEAHWGESITKPGDVLIGASAQPHVSADDLLDPVDDGLASLRARTPTPLIHRTATTYAGNEGALNFFPEALLTARFRGEFRPVVSAFIKLRTMPDAADSRSPMSHLMELISSRGGFMCDVNRPSPTDTGATVLTFWGAPRTFEDTIERAVTFLLDARDLLGADDMRAGATSDTLFAGFIGSESQSAYTCVGSGVNLAARLVAANDWGDIWIDDSLAALTASEVRSQSVGKRTFRGFSEHTTVTALLGKGDVELSSLFAGDFVARERELSTLDSWLRSIRDDASGAVAVVGEAGSGKTRLLHELEERLGVDVRWMVGHPDPIGRAPLNPVSYMIRRGMDIHLEDPAPTMRAKVESRLAAMAEVADGDLGRELVQAREPILSLIDALPIDSTFRDLSAQLKFERIVESTIAILTFEAHRRFVIALIEDGQWLDETTIEVLGRVVEGVAHLPIAVVISSRIPLSYGWVAHSLELNMLSEASIRLQASSLLDERPSEELVSLLTARTDGNPYYVEQIIQFMRDGDLLVEASDGLAPRYAGTRVPTSLQSVLIARLDRLTERVKVAVQHASVLGREFDVQVVLRMLGTSASQRDIDEAEKDEIWTALSELRYLFRHALMRDAAYEMQLHSTLRTLHETAARAIEFIAGGEPERHAFSLAYHFDEAGLEQQAAQWYRLAGEDAASQFANQDAISRFNRALELVPSDDHSTRFTLLESLEGVYRLVGASDAQGVTIDDLTEHTTHLGAEERLLALRLRTLHLTHIGDYPQAHTVGEDAMAAADEAGVVPEQFQIRIALAQAFRAVGDSESAAQLASAARAIAERADDTTMAAGANDLLGGIAYDADSYETSARFHQMAADSLAETGDQLGEIRALNNLGSALWGIGDFTKAARVHEAGAERAAAIGYRMSEGDNLDNLGGARWAIGDYPKAIEYYLSALSLRRRANDSWGVGISLSNLANAYRTAGDFDLAIEHFLEAIEVDRSIGRRRGEAFSYHGLGWAYVELDDTGSAFRAFSTALSIRLDIGEQVHAVESRAGLAAVAHAVGKPVESQQLVSEILPQLDDAFRDGADEPFRVYHACIRILRKSDTTTAASLLADVRQGLAVRSARISGEDDRASYLASVHRAFGFDPV